MASNDLKARVLYPCILCLEDHPVISRMDWRLTLGRHISFWKWPMREVARDLKGHEIFEGTWTQLVLRETSGFASCLSQM